MKKKFITQTFTFLFVILASLAFADDKTEKTFTVSDFSKIYLRGPYEVHLRQTSKCGLTIVAKDEYLEKLEVSSSGGELQIELDGKNYKKTRSIEVYINFKTLEKIDIEGAVDLVCENQIKTDNLKLEFDGAGNVELNINSNKMIAEISGVGNFEIEGQTDYHKVNFSGIGSYEAQDLHSKYTIVESNGIGSVKVYASNKFKGEANGIGSVDYYGDPDDVSIDATGLGSVNRH